MNKRDWISGFLKTSHFSELCVSQVLECFDLLLERNFESDLDKLLHSYRSSNDENFQNVINLIISECVRISNQSGLKLYAVNLVMDILLMEPYCVKFLSKGYPEAYLDENLKDIIYQSDICFCVEGYYGLSAFDWSLEFLKLKRFTIGRLQFDVGYDFHANYSNKFVTLKENSKVINVHIPRTKTPLLLEKVVQSFKEAKAFIQANFDDGNLYTNCFVCHSWLLSPDHLDMLKPDSNIRQFMNQFDIFETGIIPDYNEVWRLFDQKFTGDVNLLPNDSSLRKSYIQLIEYNRPCKYGYGIHFE